MNQFNEIFDAINASEKIVITSHRSPDGDSIGSSVAFYHFLKRLGKNPEVCHPDKSPDFLNWAIDGVDVKIFEENPAQVKELLSNADLILCLDYNGANRLGNEMGELLTSSKAKKAMIDHHLNPDDFVDYSISDSNCCSTAQLVYQFIQDVGKLDLIDQRIAETIYLGILTDTGSFRFPSVDANTHRIVANLIDAGLKHSEVHEKTFDDNRIDKLKLRGYILAENLEVVDHVAIVYVTRNQLNKFNYIKGDTEGLVNVALSLKGVVAAVFLTEDEGKVKMSFRSKGDNFVNVLAAENFDGGGHKYAAGGISFESLDATIEKIKSLIPKYF